MSTLKKSVCGKLYALLVLQLFCSSVICKLDLDEETDVFDSRLYGDNDLWDTLYTRCGRRTSYHCVQNSVFSYLDKTLDSDFQTDAVSFVQNDNNYTDICRRVKKDDPGDFSERMGRKLEAVENEGFAEFIDEVEHAEGLNRRRGRVLSDKENETDPEAESKTEEPKNIRDVSDILYDRGLKYLMTHNMEVNLPSFVFGGGKVQITPRGFDDDGGAIVKLNVVPDQTQEASPRIFFKHIKKYFRKRLMTSMLAAMLILKLLKLKILFFLPVLVGVGTAKKILLKVLLFIFPALTHLFKLCSYYHHKHAKYHHHHHQVAHHHHHIPVPVYTPVHTAPGELPAPYYEASGPGSYHSRTETPGTLADLAAWGLGEYPAAWDSPGATDPPLRYNYPTPTARVTTTSQYASAGLYAAPTKQIPQYSHSQQRYQSLTPRPTGGGVVGGGMGGGGAYDPFYSPMLQRLDAVFAQLGVLDEGCRERVVCSMYKNPARYSPHSNLVSAELSRDPMELQKPQTANSAVVRFYRYLQAARDGQELKNCLRLYAACSIATEKR